MTMATRLLEAMTGAAARRYGVEPVSELEHALQCAELADAAGADEDLVLACLLHDVGRYALAQTLLSDSLHFTEEASPGPRCRGHHELGAELVAPWVTERVAWCIAAHADAKRYLCGVEPEYHDLLSSGSRRTLPMQGGVMSTAEAQRFAAHRWAADAIALRRWDDRAKVKDRLTRPLDAWAPLLHAHFGRPLPDR
jgi:predicted HD phosphohydrolase